jgi:hypothetical protein
MELTDKCLADFNEWILINNKDIFKLSDIGYQSTVDTVTLFRYLTESMKYGVYVDFFDSVGIHFDSCHNYRLINESDEVLILGYYYELNALPNIHVIEEIEDYKTRPEARIAAIEKANEIYNSNTIE